MAGRPGAADTCTCLQLAGRTSVASLRLAMWSPSAFSWRRLVARWLVFPCSVLERSCTVRLRVWVDAVCVLFRLASACAHASLAQRLQAEPAGLVPRPWSRQRAWSGHARMPQAAGASSDLDLDGGSAGDAGLHLAQQGLLLALQLLVRFLAARQLRCSFLHLRVQAGMRSSRSRIGVHVCREARTGQCCSSPSVPARGSRPGLACSCRDAHCRPTSALPPVSLASAARISRSSCSRVSTSASCVAESPQATQRPCPQRVAEDPQVPRPWHV